LNWGIIALVIGTTAWLGGMCHAIFFFFGLVWIGLDWFGLVWIESDESTFFDTNL